MKKKLKSLSSLFLIAIFCISCQQKQTPKQYFEESPEIEVCKKAVNAYLNQDWETFRSCYSDTAKIWYNKYFLKYPAQNIDEIINNIKDPLGSMEFFKYEGVLWEMIINNAGQNWVHFWGTWIGKLSEESDDVDIVVHIAYSIENGKIVMEVGFWDNLPLYLAQQKLNSQSK
jgi:hypothetical protein